MKTSLALAGCLLAHAAVFAADPARPNFVIVFADDPGCGNLGCHGHPTRDTRAVGRVSRATGGKMVRWRDRLGREADR